MNPGRAVINAAESGASFPLKRRDQLLDYILTLMGCDDDDGFAESSLELLHTQVCLLVCMLFYTALTMLAIGSTFFGGDLFHFLVY